MNIEGIPDSISRADYIAVIGSLGLKLSSLRALDFGLNQITAVVMARDLDGRLMLDGQTNEVVVHRIVIPVVDEPITSR